MDSHATTGALEEMEKRTMNQLRMTTHPPRRRGDMYEHRFTLFLGSRSCPVSLFSQMPILPTASAEDILKLSCSTVAEFRRAWKNGVVGEKGQRKAMKKLQADLEKLMGDEIGDWMARLGLTQDATQHAAV